MADPKTRPGDRIKAASELLDRGLGKAPQHLDISTDLPAKQLTDEALRLAAAEIVAKLPANAVVEVDAPEGKAEAQTVDAEFSEAPTKPVP